MKPPAGEAPTAVGYTDDVAAKRPPKQTRRVSHQDIAREANVSRVTVSLVLAGKDQTSEETRRRVLEVAKRLRYRPNLLVQGMQTGRTFTVGVIMPSSMHFHGQVARGIHDELMTADYVPIQLWMNPAKDTKNTELEQIHRLVDRRVDGVIIFPVDASVPDVHFHEIWQRHIPLVTVDRETTTHADHVGTDEEVGGKLAAENLLSLGHKRVVHVTFPHRTGNVHRRAETFIKRMQKGGADVELVGGHLEDLVAPLKEILSRPKRPTAVFAATDPMATKVYGVAASLGLKIPVDISVMGYADFPFARDLVPPLTTVRQDPYQMGRIAAQLLLDRILDRASGEASKRIHLAPELIVRGSTAQAANSRS
ncbi:MAG: LacI family transcriptional regulator [Humisphaera sp.]|nr:LacI family transcriptional regulator [Humisphaera sp.]